jgi:hypothetical protein
MAIVEDFNPDNFLTKKELSFLRFMAGPKKKEPTGLQVTYFDGLCDKVQNLPDYSMEKQL